MCQETNSTTNSIADQTSKIIRKQHFETRGTILYSPVCKICSRIMISVFQTVVEQCLFEEDHSRPFWTKLRREAWISSAVYGLARPIQVCLLIPSLKIKFNDRTIKLQNMMADFSCICRSSYLQSQHALFLFLYQEFGLARFKNNQVKAMKGLEFALSKIQSKIVFSLTLLSC